MFAFASEDTGSRPTPERRIQDDRPKNVIPAQGEAGNSGRMRPDRETALAYMPVRALEAGIQRLAFTAGHCAIDGHVRMHR